MKIVLIGTGKVGKTIIKHISKEGHDLCIIDKNPKLVNELVNKLNKIRLECNNLQMEARNNTTNSRNVFEKELFE